MDSFDKSKVITKFDDFVTLTSPIIGRKYTLTHSDTSGELFLNVGINYAKNMLSDIRDEVLMEFICCNNMLILSGRVMADISDDMASSKMRTEIFLREMPIALMAVRYGDRVFYENDSQLDNVPIFIHFYSKYSQYNKIYEYGKMKDYMLS